jgi:hypothetical protein
MAIGPLLPLAAKRSLGCRPVLCLLVVSSAELSILTSVFLVLFRVASSRGGESPHPRTLSAKVLDPLLVTTSGKCRATLFHLDVDTVIPLLLPVLTSVVPHCFTSLRRLLLNALWFGLVWFGLVGFCCQDSGRYRYCSSRFGTGAPVPRTNSDSHPQPAVLHLSY